MVVKFVPDQNSSCEHSGHILTAKKFESLFEIEMKIRVLPHSNCAQHCRKPHLRQSASLLSRRPGNAPSPPATAACSAENRQEKKQELAEDLSVASHFL